MNVGAHIDDLVSVVDLAGVEVYPGIERSPAGFGSEAAAGLEVPITAELAVTSGARFLRWTVSDERGGRFVDPFTVEDPLRVLLLGVGVGVRRRF